MYVYQSFEKGLYTVGFYAPDGKWVAESDHDNPQAAAARVRYLNGGREAEPDGGSWDEYKHIKGQKSA